MFATSIETTRLPVAVSPGGESSDAIAYMFSMEHVRDTLSPDARIARVAERQHGVVCFEQLRTAGLGAGAINSRVRLGRLHRLHRGVFAVGHRHLSREAHWLGAVFALGGGAALSHMSAAALWGIRASSAAAVHVTVPTSAGRPHRAGIVVHRSRTLTAEDIDERDAIRVTSVARTLLDLAATLAPGPLERAVERSLSLRLFDLAAVDMVIAANPRRPGVTTLADLVAMTHDEPPLTRSDLEALMRDLCDAHAIPRPEVNAWIEGAEVDFFWRAQRLVVETDGHETHRTRAAFENDRAKDARLTMRGYRVVRFTHRQLVYAPQTVATTLCDAALLISDEIGQHARRGRSGRLVVAADENAADEDLGEQHHARLLGERDDIVGLAGEVLLAKLDPA